MSKLSMIFNGSRIIGLGGIFGRGEVSQMNPFTPNNNFCSPFFRNFESSYKSCGVIASHSCIAMVLGIRALAQIGAAIIKSVVVYVVYLLSFYAGKNLSSHNDASSLVWYVDVPNGIKAVRAYVPLRKPVKLREPFKIRSIYDGILSLCERNKTVGCIKRLVNCVTLHAVFHRSTSNRLIETSRKYITASVFSILFLAPCAFSQSTTVSGTIADSNGQAFAFGSFKVEFFSNGLPTPFYWNGTPFDISTHFSGLLDGTGSFAGVVVPSSNFITPVGTGWRFTVCSAATTSQCYAQIVTVTGVTLNVTGLIVPVPIVVNANQFSQPAAYTDGEIAGPILGFTYYPINTNCLRVYAGGFPPNWVNICGGGGGAGCTLSGTDTGVVTEHPIGTCYDSPHFTWDDGMFKQNLQAGDGTNVITVGASETFTLGSSNNYNANTSEIGTLGNSNTVSATTQIFDVFTMGDFNSISSPVGGAQEFYTLGNNNTQSNVVDNNYIFGNNNNFTDVQENLFIMGHDSFMKSSTPGTEAPITNCVEIGGNNEMTATPPHGEESCAIVGFGNTVSETGLGFTDPFIFGEHNTLASTTHVSNDVHFFGGFNTSEDSSGNTSNIEVVGEQNDVNNAQQAEILGYLNSTHGCAHCLAIGQNVAAVTSNEMDIGMSATAEVKIMSGSVKILGNAAAVTIASGTAALGTGAISSGACATVVTVGATGVLSTDVVTWTPNASIKAVTGYAPSTSGGLSIVAYPTANNVNFDVCNWSTGSITPGAVTLNWGVRR